MLSQLSWFYYFVLILIKHANYHKVAYFIDDNNKLFFLKLKWLTVLILKLHMTTKVFRNLSRKVNNQVFEKTNVKICFNLPG